MVSRICACSLIGIPASIDQTMCCKKCNNADLQCQMRSTRGLTEKDSCFRTFVLSIREQAAQPACPALANAGHRIQNSSATDCSNRIALLKAIQLWRHMKNCTFCGTSRGMHNLLHVVPSIRLQQPRRMPSLLRPVTLQYADSSSSQRSPVLLESRRLLE